MKGAGYWKGRAGQRVTEAERASAPYLRKIAARYREAARSIDRDIRKVLDAYRQDFTRAEAEAFLREEIPMAEYNRLKEILPEIQDERYRKELTMRLNAQSVRYRITRMQYIRQLILARLSEGADYEKRASSELYRETAKEGYLRTLFDIQKGVGIGFSAAMLPEKTIGRMESARWYGRNYSASVWRNRGLVAEAAASVLESGILAGQSIRRMSKELMEQTYTHSVSNAARLIRTEVNYFCNQGALESYREAEIEEYEFLATLDLRTSAACRELDGKKFPLAKAQPGKNCPPMHPYCRSTVIPIIDTPGLARMEKRSARDAETGKSVQTGDMSYEEWYNRFVRGGKFADTSLQRIPVTPEAVEAVPLVESSLLSPERSAQLRQAHRELLRRVMQEPVGTEAAAFYRMNMEELSFRVGTIDTVKAENFRTPYIAMHNHPDGLTFSEMDIATFLQRKNLKVLTAVGNNGIVYMLEKSIHFQLTDYVAFLNEVEERHPNRKASLDNYLNFIYEILNGGEPYGVIYRENKGKASKDS